MFWEPDSCGCRIELTNSWTLIGFERKCPDHQGLIDSQAWDVIWRPDNTGENQRGPSNTLAEILDKGPNTLYDITTDGARSFKRGINVSWQWTGTIPDRVLSITVTGINLSQNQRNNIITFLNNRFGVGKVVLT